MLRIVGTLSRAISLVLGRNPDDKEDTSKYGSAEHLKAAAALIRILGNAGLEEAGENAEDAGESAEDAGEDAREVTRRRRAGVGRRSLLVGGGCGSGGLLGLVAAAEDGLEDADQSLRRGGSGGEHEGQHEAEGKNLFHCGWY